VTVSCDVTPWLQHTAVPLSRSVRDGTVVTSHRDHNTQQCHYHVLYVTVQLWRHTVTTTHSSATITFCTWRYSCDVTQWLQHTAVMGIMGRVRCAIWTGRKASSLITPRTWDLRHVTDYPALASRRGVTEKDLTACDTMPSLSWTCCYSGWVHHGSLVFPLNRPGHDDGLWTMFLGSMVRGATRAGDRPSAAR
jgi:hypothetical protein